MSLESQMVQLLREYESILTPNLKHNYLPIIKKAFFPYLLQEFSAQINDINYLFERVLTCEHIINAGVYYVDNTKRVTDIAAVKKYLSAVYNGLRKLDKKTA